MSQSVLVVDDDREIRGLYRLILEREGFHVDEASNGAEALNYLLSHTPNVILMDMLMPMLGGEAVLRRIQKMRSLQHVRIVVITAYPRFRESVNYLPPDQFLVKPARPEAIVRAVRAAALMPA